MIAHVSIGASDLAAARRFHVVLSPLGYRCPSEPDDALGLAAMGRRAGSMPWSVLSRRTGNPACISASAHRHGKA